MSKGSNKDRDIAIVGMGSLFPQAGNLKEYWRLLSRGEDAITEVPDTHWSAEDYFRENPGKGDYTYCRRGGFLSPISFDPTEFGMPPNILEATDTAQLLALMVAKRALEDAGYGDGGRSWDRERTGVVLGVTGTQELVIPLSSRLGFPFWERALADAGVSPEQSRQVLEQIAGSYVSWQENSFPGLLGNVVAGRIANRFDLGGTNCAIDAACASSLSAVHLAVMELTSGNSDMMITGGVDALNDIFMHMCFAKTGVLSFTGDARPFSSDADGTVLGEGLGLFILKRLADAEKDGDRIYAVIKSMGTASDGRSSGIYAPVLEGQLRALKRAYTAAGVEPATVELIEAHGTGTRVGDAIEFKALRELFQGADPETCQCAIGSVKSMIGHTKAAAGAAGLVKAALALHYKAIPPTLKVDASDPKLNIEETPFYISTTLRPWLPVKNHPRRAGLSAFGFGGSNYHMVLEEYTAEKQDTAWDGTVEIVAFSGTSKSELARQIKEFTERLEDQTPGVGHVFDGVCRYAAGSRQSFHHDDPHRALIVLERTDDVAEKLSGAVDLLQERQEVFFNSGDLYYGSTEAQNPETSDGLKNGKTAFIFPGQGSQYACMARDLVTVFPEAQAVFETADSQFANFRKGGAVRLSDYVFPPGYRPDKKQQVEETLRLTDIAQPAIGAVSIGMAAVLNRFGLTADMMCGHSFGELSALCCAGWMDVETFLSLAAARGKYMAAAGKEKGAMLAVKADLNDIEQLIADNDLDLILANRNSHNQGVISGRADEIDRAAVICREKKMRAVKLPVSAAFHTELVQDAAKPFRDYLRKKTLHPTDITVFSNTTAEACPTDTDQVKKLLGRQLLHPVNFVQEIENMYAAGARLFLEIGPKSVLTGLVQSILKGKVFSARALDTSGGRHFGVRDLAGTLAFFAAAGRPVSLENWEQLPDRPEREQKMSIPICGANYRKEKPGRSPRPVGIGDRTSATPDTESREQVPPATVSEPPHGAPSEAAASGAPAFKSVAPAQSAESDRSAEPDRPAPLEAAVIKQALQVVSESLQSLQALQQQTAQAHHKFLETQNEAGRSLNAVIEKTRHIGEIVLDGGTVPGAAASGIRDMPGAPGPTAGVTSETAEAGRVPASASLPFPASADHTPTDTPTDTPVDTLADAIIESAMLDIVSRVTGYPVEMLTLEMDIENDLGIDSIKRVEILSIFEEEHPGIPSAQPEDLAEMRSLGEICDHLLTLSGGTTGATDPVAIADTAGGGSGVSAGHIESAMLDIVSRVTGYPVEMLTLEMDIENDLGIDSIKRVEILSIFEEEHPGIPSAQPEDLAEMRSLGEICDHLLTLSGGDGTAAPDRIPPVTAAETTEEKEALSAESLPRRIVRLVTAPVLKERISPAEGRRILVCGHDSQLGPAIAAALTESGLPADWMKSDPTDEDLAVMAGLVLVPGMQPVSGPNSDPDLNPVWPAADETIIKEIFDLVARASLVLSGAADGKSPMILAAVTRLDGALGFGGGGRFHPLQAALGGLIKTAAIEWDQAVCRHIDVDPDWNDIQAVARAAAEELSAAGGPVEIALTADTRRTTALAAEACPEGDIRLGPDDVVVVSGGARGVTAQCALTLAAATGAAFVLLGRSPLPEAEPAWLADAVSEADMKKRILNNEFSGKATPAEVEESYRRHLANREVAATIENLRVVGRDVAYYPVDVRDAAAVGEVFDRVRSSLGEITCIVHGAGVVDDRFIVDKTREQFDRVFDTKVAGARALLTAARAGALRYLVFFSSVTARMGNRGQVDYAMANEVLNKTAQKLAVDRPACRVLSINWGPWDGGMVTPSLKREFEKNQVMLIPLEAGSRCLSAEMAAVPAGPVEIVIGAGFADTPSPAEEFSADDDSRRAADRSAADPTGNGFSTAFERDISLEGFPVLKSHMLNRIPVVPFALAAEWVGSGALHTNPGLHMTGIDEMRVLSGIKLNGNEAASIAVMTRKARKSGTDYEVPVLIRTGPKAGEDRIYYTARALLSGDFPAPPVYQEPSSLSAVGYARSVESVYADILFHGSDLSGIREIVACSPEGIKARVDSAPPPRQWIAQPLRSAWLADPLVLDAAFQLAIVWCYENAGLRSLPVGFGRFRQYREVFPADGVTVVLEIRERTDHKITGDFIFIDAGQTVVADMTGYEAVMDRSLDKAFLK